MGARSRRVAWREPRLADPFAGPDVPDELLITLRRTGRYYTGRVLVRLASEARFTRTTAGDGTESTQAEWIFPPEPAAIHSLSIEMRRRPTLPLLLRAISRNLWARAEGLDQVPTDMPGQLAFDLPDLPEPLPRRPR